MVRNRQLAAIMFADIVGYTSMMQTNEAFAISCRKKLKKKLDEILDDHQGKIIEFRGDGALCKFTSTILGVKAAIALQRYMLLKPIVPLRIGMHTGDVLIDGRSLYGDVLNIASRMESFAVPGSILISGKTYDDIKNQKDIQTTPMGSFMLKNVKQFVEVYAISNKGITIPEKDALEGKGEKLNEKPSPAPLSIAVLPFLNLSNDPEQDYLGEGITEEIINSLTHIRELKVAGRIPSGYIQGQQIDRMEIAKKLNVSSLVEGSIQKQGEKLRITARLVNAHDGFQLWSERYDRKIDDLFVIQDEIAIAVTKNLQVTLLEKDRLNILKKPTDHTRAYDLYLKGRFYLNRRGEGIRKAFEYFQQAIILDPSFALPYSGLGDAYSILSFYGSLSPHLAMPRARENAEKAIQLDPGNAEGYSSLAFISMFYDWNWENAKRYFEKAFEANPDYALAHYWFSFYLSFIEGRFDEAILYARKAAEKLEPLVSLSHHVLSVNYLNAGKYELALKEAELAVELDPHSFPGLRAMGLSLAMLKRYDESIEVFQNCNKVSGRHAWPLAELSWVYSLLGEFTECKKIYEELTERSKKEPISSLHLSGAAYFARQYQSAYDLMERAFEEKSSTLPCIKIYPLCNYVKTDPLFKSFLSRLKYPKRNKITQYSLN